MLRRRAETGDEDKEEKKGVWRGRKPVPPLGFQTRPGIVVGCFSSRNHRARAQADGALQEEGLEVLGEVHVSLVLALFATAMLELGLQSARRRRQHSGAEFTLNSIRTLLAYISLPGMMSPRKGAGVFSTHTHWKTAAPSATIAMWLKDLLRLSLSASTFCIASSKGFTAVCRVA
eukprot:3648213-Rhodomonas_salina.2